MPTTKLTYPIVLHPEKEGGYAVEIPDINGGSWTQGETIEEAILKAEELIGVRLQTTTDYPRATPAAEVAKGADDILALAIIDLDEFRKLHSTTVRKNVSIPEYLVVLGQQAGLNFSKVLTNALKDKLES